MREHFKTSYVLFSLLLALVYAQGKNDY